MAISITHVSGYRTYGSIVLERLADLAVKPAVRPFVGAFAAQHAAYEKAAEGVDAARLARDEHLAKIAQLDDALDAGVMALANEIVGAKLGDRKNPFRGYSSYAPSDLIALAYATEQKQVLSLVGKVRAKGSKKPELVAALDGCAKGARAVAAALKGLARPQAAYERALHRRDGLLPAWQKALHRLDVQSAAAWMDEPEIHAALFAPPEAVQQPTPRRRRANGAAAGPVAANGIPAA